MNTTLLELRNKAKKSSPRFVVKESKFSARVKRRWRFPRGKHSKVRQMHCGRPALPEPGYGSPREVKGLHRSGLAMVLVHTAVEMEALDPVSQGVVIGSTVGKKNKLELLALAQRKKLTVLNIADVAASAEEIKKKFAERKENKKQKLSELSKKDEEKKKKAEEKKVKEEKEKAEKDEHKHDHGHEHDLQPEEEKKQRELAEKTITKKQ